ncbi:radical SAM protein [Synechococcus sp. BO 8801]|uniref:radical SAM/SPASM domain-containing protein n=1 Tax=Synechococcus sp. BO 8801 TaxID=169670 RepID=UPI00117C8C57|nr:radical SAM protein [Synechococcus sp. BO 8801]
MIYHADLNLTNRCELRCKYCHSSSGQPKKDELSQSEWIRAIKKLHESGIQSISFAGGEPMLHPEVIPLVNYACSLPSFRVALITGGAFNHDLLKRLPTSEHQFSISLSIDHYEQAKFNLTRPPRQGYRSSYSFESAIATAEALGMLGISWSVNTVLTSTNAPEIEELYTFVVKRLGAAGLLLIVCANIGRGSKSDGQGLPYSQFKERLLYWTEQKSKGLLSAMRISTISPWEFYLPLAEMGIELAECENLWHYSTPSRFDALEACDTSDTTGITEIAIDSNGDIYPSVLLSGLQSARLGNILNSDLNFIQNSSIFQQFQKPKPYLTYPACSTCLIVRQCRGGSKARSFWLMGSTLSMDPFCPRASDLVSPS